MDQSKETRSRGAGEQSKTLSVVVYVIWGCRKDLSMYEWSLAFPLHRPARARGWDGDGGATATHGLSPTEFTVSSSSMDGVKTRRNAGFEP